MPLSEDEKRAIKETWAKREKRHAEEMEKRKSLALEKAYAVARLLKNEYNIEKVYLYGSLALGEYFDSHSDINIFIEGWKGSKSFWRMCADALDMASPFPVGIVDANDAFPSLVEKVHMEGIILE